jgi:hypothetical protein
LEALRGLPSLALATFASLAFCFAIKDGREAISNKLGQLVGFGAGVPGMGLQAPPAYMFSAALSLAPFVLQIVGEANGFPVGSIAEPGEAIRSRWELLQRLFVPSPAVALPVPLAVALLLCCEDGDVGAALGLPAITTIPIARAAAPLALL